MKNRKEILALVTKAIGMVVIAVSLLVIAERLLHILSFRNALSTYSYSATRFETAVCFLLSGSILLMIRDGSLNSNFRNRASSILIYVLLLLACIFLFSKIFEWNITMAGVFGSPVPIAADAAAEGNMNLIVAFNFLMLALTFLFLRKRKFHILAQVFLIAMQPGSLLVILNRVYEPSFLSAVQSTASVSIVTPALFILISVGLFFSPVLEYVHFSFLKRIALFFLLITLFRSIVFFAIDKNNKLTSDKETLVQQNQAVLVLAEKISSLSNNLQSAVRGYVITGQESKPSFSDQFKDSIQRLFHTLRLLTLNHPGQQPRIDTLEKDVRAFVDQENLLMRVRQREGFVAAQNTVESGQGSLLLGRVNELVAVFEQAERLLVAKHAAGNDLIILNSSKLFTLFQGIAFLLLVLAFQMIYKHITRRNRAEEALKKSLRETSDYKFALNESSILAIFDQDRIIKEVNDNLCSISRYHREELIGQHLEILDSGYHSKAFMDSLLSTIVTGKEWKGEIKRKAKDGGHFWMDTTIIPFLGDNGRPHQYVAIHFDITKRKELEEEMMQFNVELQRQVKERTREVVENEQKYRFLLQNMKEGIQVIGYQWEYIYVNDAAIKYSKLSESQLLGLRMPDVFPGIEETDMFRVFQRCMRSRLPEILVNEFVFADGSRQWFEYSIQPVAEGLFILSIDVTERKKAEQQLQESEHFLNASQQVSKIGSYVFDFATGYWKCSAELADIFGIMPDQEHTVEEWLALMHPDYGESMEQYFEQEVILKRKRFDKEYKIINKRYKHECWVHGIGDLEFHADGRLSKMLGTVQDVTERREIIERLRVNNEWYELVNKATLDTIWDWDFATQKGTWGEGLCKTFGYSREQLAFDASWRKKFIHPDDLPRISENFTYYLDSFSDNWQDEYRFLCADGTYKHVYDRGYVLRNADKKPYRSIGALTDISEQKRLEKELVQQQLRQHKLVTEINIQAQEKERNELGRELHDNVNQILATVKLYLGMIKSGQSSGVEGILEKSYDYVNEAMIEIRKLSHSLVAPSLGNISLKQSLEELLEDTNLIGHLNVRLEMDDIFETKYLDKNRELMIYRVVQEQINNIIKYAGAGEAVVNLTTAEGNILLSISDNGNGFEPSEQIKGIGLKNIVSRVDLYAGKMNIISAPGMGCTLEVSIPL